MTYAVLAVMTVIFVEIFVRLHVWSNVSSIFTISSETVRVIRSDELDDAHKERAARTGALSMLKDTALFVAKLGVAIAALLLAYAPLVLWGGVSHAEFLETVSSWVVIAGCLLFSMLYVRIRHVVRR